MSWQLRSTPSKSQWEIVDSATQELVAIVRSESAARLIAAVPDFLKFTRKAYTDQVSHGQYGDAELISEAEALIQRAKGGEHA